MSVFNTSLGRIGILTRVLGLLVFIIALALIIWESTFSSHPGPTVYYSHFSGLFFAVSLAFSSIQLLLATRSQAYRLKKWVRVVLVSSTYVYWAVVAISGLASAISYGFTPKPDSTGIQVLIFLMGLTGGYTSARRHWIKPRLAIDTYSSQVGQVGDTDAVTKPTRQDELGALQRLRAIKKALRYFNRFLKIVHVVICILFIVGAVNLAKTYHFPNPGTTVTVESPDGNRIAINYNCTTVHPKQSAALPTFWFTSSPAHGIVDFLGLQTTLAEVHGRNSCSYDPPNFGWSGAMPSSQSTFFDPFDELLEATGRKAEEKVLVGWAAGVNSAWAHAVANPQTVRGLVLLDAGPEGIEWLDMKRALNWTDDQMLQYRQTDMQSRIELARLVLSIGIPWGLMPIFFPYNSSTYYDSSMYATFHAQSLKEDMWAMQYYALLEQASLPIPDYRDSPQVPSGMPTFALLTYDAGTDAASSEYYREEKLKAVNYIAGGNLTSPVVWCKDSDCSLDFPVSKWNWTAQTLVDLGV